MDAILNRVPSLHLGAAYVSWKQFNNNFSLPYGWYLNDQNEEFSKCNRMITASVENAVEKGVSTSSFSLRNSLFASGLKG